MLFLIVKKEGIMKKLLFLIFLIFSIMIAGFLFFIKKSGTNTFSSKYEDFQVVVEGNPVKKELFARKDGQYYFSTDLIKETLDENISLNNDTVEINNRTGKKILKVSKDEYDLNGKNIALRDPVYEENGSLFLPIESFVYDYPVKVRYNKDKNVLIMDYTNKEYASATPKGDGVNMREGNSTSEPIVTTLNKDAELFVYNEKDGWYQVREKFGYAGWIRGDNLIIDKIDNSLVVKKEGFSKSVIPKPLNITWDYTYGKVKDSAIASIKPIKGLNVMIPTWFSIDNENGEIIDRGNIEYTKAYSALGIDVWGYVDNKFDKELTHKFLQNQNGINNAINNLISSAKKYGMKGINVDFENTLIEDRENITLFVKKLSEEAKKEDLIISVCVTPQISSDVTKEPYDRKELSKYADYVILMAYDQHWGSSEKAGSVAEYKWVEGNINLSIRDIGQEKFILGVPFYSRLWKDGPNGLDSSPVGMAETQTYISSQGLEPEWDPEAKQYFIEKSGDNKTEKIWVEDANSIEWKTSLVRKYNLAGVASWRLGFETQDIWDTIHNEFQYYNYIHK